MSDDQRPVYPYPTTHEERLACLTTGTPREFRPYVSSDPDLYRDGLLAGALAHKPGAA